MSLIVKYNVTGMSSDIGNVNPNSDRTWDENTLYHNINLILDRWHSNGSKIGLFRSKSDYGPKVNINQLDIWLHPFLWKNNWHLVIGFSAFKKLLLVNCSNVGVDEDDETSTPTEAAFPYKSCMGFENFINFFQSKITKEALQFPKLCSELLDPALPNNCMNLLTLILAFCLRTESMIKLFCDPTMSPRQFDVSDLHVYVENLDLKFRSTLNTEVSQINLENPIAKRATASEAISQMPDPESLSSESETDDIDESNNQKANNSKESNNKMDNNPTIDAVESKSIINKGKVSKDLTKPKKVSIVEPVKSQSHRQNQNQDSKENEQEMIKSTRARATTNTLSVTAARRRQAGFSSDEPPSKRLRTDYGTAELPIELDELESEDEEDEEDEEDKNLSNIKIAQTISKDKSKEKDRTVKQQVKKEMATKEHIKRETAVKEQVKKETVAKQQTKKAKTKQEVTAKKESTANSKVKTTKGKSKPSLSNRDLSKFADPKNEEFIKPKTEEEEKAKLFHNRIVKAFLTLDKISTFANADKQVDIVLEMIESWTHSKFTNPNLNESQTNFHKWPLLIREHLFAEYKRQTRREFDEDQLDELLEVDHRNQVFPLFCSNNRIYLINIRSKDGFHTDVKVLVIGNKQQSEKEIMKNYAFKKLIQMYVWKYTRLITVIKPGTITITDGRPYEVFMVALYCLHRFVMKNRFDVTFSPHMEDIENYMDEFKILMEAIQKKDLVKRDLSYKRILKYLRC
ncbi:hypothetical protein DAMA08_030710 [Martiniozyma asiatica (nom. inval.)]|nr:hypothetical protein DAMA08_030710 [Martiniozyma asiatica]